MRTSLSIVLVTLTLSLMGMGCEVAPPFAGPGWDNGLTADTAGPFFVAATHLQLDADDADVQSIFDAEMEKIRGVLDEQPGLIGYSFRVKLLGSDYWTLTAWESEADAIAWVSHDTHVDAIVALSGRVSAGETTHYEMEADDMPPTWEDAQERLAADGYSVY